MKTIARDCNWWAYLFRVTHREQIDGTAQREDRLTEFIVAALELEPGMRVLDVACGSGVHLLRLARRHVVGTGVEVAPSLVRHATRRAAEAGLTDRLRYLVGDMRDLTAAVGDETFDAVTLLSGSFGFFDDEANQCVLDGVDVRRTSQGVHDV